ncbi:MAG: hypothetical protein HYS87_00570 [Candidatus Colwellbacteria bacterium]|nr:hypothetical protein [Candidatus Colwellbacteria bacterium]
MNLNFFEKFKNLPEAKLSKESKSRIRENLVNFMQGDVRAPETRRLISERSKKFSLEGLIGSLRIIPMPIIALLIALSLSGGVSFAAENSLPGDALYPIKVGVNEQVRGALAFGAKAKAKLDTQLAARRLEEAEQLSAKTRMDADVRERIEANFKAHAERVEARIAEFEEKDDFTSAADIASRFEASLRAHEQILERLQASVDESIKFHVNTLKGSVEARGKTAAEKRTKLESDVVKKGADEDVKVKAKIEVEARGGINAAKNVIASVKSQLERKQDSLDVEAIADAEARVSTAESLVVQAEAKLEAEAKAEAFNLANQAIRVANEARALINASIKIDTRVRFLGPPGIIEIRINSNNGKIKTEVRTEGEAEVEVDSDGDAEVETESDTEFESETEIEIEAESDTRGKSNSEAKSQAKAESNNETKTESDSAEAEAEVEVEAEVSL